MRKLNMNTDRKVKWQFDFPCHYQMAVTAIDLVSEIEHSDRQSAPDLILAVQRVVLRARVQDHSKQLR